MKSDMLAIGVLAVVAALALGRKPSAEAGTTAEAMGQSQRNGVSLKPTPDPFGTGASQTPLSTANALYKKIVDASNAASKAKTIADPEAKYRTPALQAQYDLWLTTQHGNIQIAAPKNNSGQSGITSGFGPTLPQQPLGGARGDAGEQNPPQNQKADGTIWPDTSSPSGYVIWYGGSKSPYFPSPQDADIYPPMAGAPISGIGPQGVPGPTDNTIPQGVNASPSETVDPSTGTADIVPLTPDDPLYGLGFGYNFRTGQYVALQGDMFRGGDVTALRLAHVIPDRAGGVIAQNRGAANFTKHFGGGLDNPTPNSSPLWVKTEILNPANFPELNSGFALAGVPLGAFSDVGTEMFQGFDHDVDCGCGRH